MSDYSNLFLDLHNKSEKALILHYEELQTEEFTYYKDKKGALNINKVIKYLNYLYSIQSPLIPKYQDLRVRKEAAAELAGFKEDTKEWKQVEADLFNIEDPDVARMIVRFMIMQDNRKWSIICSAEQVFYENQLEIIKSSSDDKDRDRLSAQKMKNGFIDASMELSEKIDKLYSELFQNNEDVEEKFKEDKNYFSSPESVADKLDQPS